MAEVQALANRNVVVVGKTGGGKSTVANKVLGLEKFAIKNVANSVTSEVEAHCSTFYDQSSRTRYNFKVIDTIGVFDTKQKNDDVIAKIKTFFRKDSPEGINLVLFVFRKGRFTDEERRTFDYIIGNFSDQISDFSALVLTCCEGQTDAANQEFHASFEEEASDIVSFMKRGIYMVGFPDISKIKPEMKQVMEEETKEKAEMLRKVVMKADKKCLGKEMFELTFWEKVSECFIL